MAAFPADLPNPLNDGSTSQTPINNILRTSFDTGVPKQRRRFTGVAVAVVYNLMLTTAQVSELENFYYNTLNSASQFTWTDFKYGAAGPQVNYRFTSPPSYVPQQDAADGAQIATLNLEIVP